MAVGNQNQIWSDAQLEQWSKDAIEAIAIDVNCIWVRECIAITAGISLYTLPNYVKTVSRVTWRGKTLEPLSWEEMEAMSPGTVIISADSPGNIETTRSRPEYYAMHPTNPYDIRLFPVPSESFAASGEPDPYAPTPNSPSCIVSHWRVPDLSNSNPVIAVPPYILRRTQKAYVLWKAFAAEGKGQDLDASQFYKSKYDFLIKQFRSINEGCFISKRYTLGENGFMTEGRRYPKPTLGPNFERVIF
jgi:hypothetical protein